MSDFDVKAARQAGYSDKEIAEHLAEQNNFDLENARNSGYQDHEVIQHLTGEAAPGPVADEAPNPAMTAAAGALLGGAGKAGQAALSGTANLFSKTPAVSPDEARGVQAWLNSQLYLHGNAPKNVNIPLHEFEKVPGLPGKITDTKLAQQVVEAIRPTPASRVPVTRTINGVPTVVRHETVPAQPGVDIAHLIEKYTPEELSGMRAALARAGQTISNATPSVVKSAMASPVIGKIARTVMPAAALGGVGYDVQDALNRWNKGDYGRAITSGVGAAANAAAAFPYQPPVARAVEMGVGMAAPAINAGVDYLMGDQGKATGGPVHLADGGQPYIGYPNVKKSSAIPKEPLSIDEVQNPKTEAFVRGLMGTRPDELGGSVFNPHRNENTTAGELGYALGLGAQALPIAGPALKGYGKLAGSVLNKSMMGEGPDFLKGIVPQPNFIIKPKGGQWLNDVKEVIEPYHHDKVLENLARDQAKVDEHTANGYTNDYANEILRSSKNMKAVNDWARGNLTNYIKNEMGTEGDPLRALHEQGISHLSDKQLARPSQASSELKIRRLNQGYPEHGVAQSPMAKVWENLSDSQILPDTAGRLSSRGEDAIYPWLGKVDPSTKIYDLPGSSTGLRLGFDDLIQHLDEELSAGNIRPEQLSKVTVPDAVKRFYLARQEEIKQKELAQQAAKAALPVHTQYPDGFRWIELNRPGSFAAESDAMGHSVRGYEPQRGDPDWVPESADHGFSGYGLGGWNAIKSGKAKIYSLVDPKGMPHATIETEHDAPSMRVLNQLDPAERAHFQDQMQQWEDIQPATPSGTMALQQQGEVLKSMGKELPPNIKQIKGKSNNPVIEKYHPYVQDFLNNNEWGDVMDTSNAAAMQTSRYTPDVHAHAANIGMKMPRFLDVGDEYDLMHHMDQPADTPVPESLQKYIPQQEAPAPTTPAPTEQKMLQGVYRGYAGAGGDGSDTLFATPQKRVADYYAEKRAGQTGEAPHVDMLMIDPFAGKTYGHSTMGTGGQEPMFTQAKKLAPEDVQGQTQLYKKGGEVSLPKMKAALKNKPTYGT